MPSRQCEESPSLLNEEEAIVEAFKQIGLYPSGGGFRMGGKVEAFSLAKS